MRITLLRAAALALACAPSIAPAQVAVLPQVRNAAGQYVPSQAVVCIDTTGAATGCAGDPIRRTEAVDRGALLPTAGTAYLLMPANPTRRGFAVQNQSNGLCFVSSTGTATQDWHSLQIASGGYFETPLTHGPIGPISIICTAPNAGIYAREW